MVIRGELIRMVESINTTQITMYISYFEDARTNEQKRHTRTKKGILGQKKVYWDTKRYNRTQKGIL